MLFSGGAPGAKAVSRFMKRPYTDAHTPRRILGTLRHGLCTGLATALLFLVLAWSAAHGQQASPDGRPPNIVVFLADDIGREAFGSYGGTSYETPHIDRLAAGGMRFTRAYATPLCTPTRAQLLTGKYNFRNYETFGVLDTAERTFANYLQSAGYTTAVAGKWQLSGSFQTPHHFGFHEYLVWQLERPDYWGRYKDPNLTRHGEPTRQHIGQYGPDVLQRFVLDFIGRQRQGPFAVFYANPLTHDPFQPPPGHPDYASHDSRTVNDARYFGPMVEYMDRQVGELTARLDALGIRENTLILFMGDNGTAPAITSRMGERLIRGDKARTTEAGTHVAFIANWKGTIGPGQVRDDLVDVADVFPTLLDAGRVTIANIAHDMITLYPTLVEGTPHSRAWIFQDYYRNRTPGPSPQRRGIGEGSVARYAHDGRFKLYSDGRFFDYLADPLEQTPLSIDALPTPASEAHGELRLVMDRMEAEIRRVEAGRADVGPTQR
jgi:hypothetical protein